VGFRARVGVSGGGRVRGGGARGGEGAHERAGGWVARGWAGGFGRRRVARAGWVGGPDRGSAWVGGAGWGPGGLGVLSVL